MRFLCEQCKAKYQIADEKVAGKTVRMKCRKCGHLIEVRAEVTETSVATQFPTAPSEPDGDDSTRIGVDAAAIMSAHASKESPTRPQAARTTGKTGLATSLAAAKPTKPAPPAAGGSALAGAFQKSVGHGEQGSLLEISTSSEWYVAINGVPVGPVRIAELRRKASTGAVTEESLVWQEGMEEWRPLRTITELAAIVQEGLSAERPSLVTPAPPAPRAPGLTPQPSRASSRPGATERASIPDSPQGLRPAASASVSSPQAGPPRSNVVSLTSRLATAEKLEPEPIADPFAIPPADAKPPISGIDPLGPPHGSPPVGSPFGPAVANATAPSLGSPTVVIPRKSGPNWVVLGMVVAFGAFGVTAGIAVFFQHAPPPAPVPTIVVTTQAAAPTAPGATGGPASSAAEITSGQPAMVAAAGHAQTGGGGGGSNSHATSTAPTRNVDPSIAALLGGPNGGPSVGGGAGGGGAGSALSEEAIQRVVQQRSAGVKRTCWERGGGTQANVNVRVHLSIASAGNVQNASADGNDPIVAKCIENSVRSWSFPPSSGSTTVDIPFHFLRQ